MRLAAAVSSLFLLIACSPESTIQDPVDNLEIITGTGGSDETSSQTTSVSTTTGAGGAASSSSASSSGAGGEEPACPDNALSEQNESETTAYKVKAEPIDDCDGSGDLVEGVLAGASDVDWYFYLGDDSSFCVVDPSRALTQSEDGLRLCKFVRCTDSSATTEFSCPSGTTPETSPEGRDGCCGTGAFDIDDVNCTGSFDETTEVYIRIDQPDATSATCNGYTLTYHY
jgi:hypothetical protein